jgi:hypothetical protein
MEKPIKLPVKLPVNERKKLSLIIESNNNDKSDQTFNTTADTIEQKISEQSNEIINNYNNNNNNFDQFRLSNDTYLMFSEEKNDSIDNSSTDSNSYYVLNELLSSETLNSNSDVSNPTLNEHMNENDIDDDDEEEDTYYMPSGLIKNEENDLNYVFLNVNQDEFKAKEINQESNLLINTTTSDNSIQTNEISSNKPQLPKKMNRKEFQNSFRALKGTIRQPSIQNSNSENATHYKDEDIYCPPSTQRMFTYGFYFYFIDS